MTRHPLMSARLMQADLKSLRRSRPAFRAPPAIGTMIGRIQKASRERYGFAESHILDHWADIVGDRLAEETCPERLGSDRRGVGKTLTIRVVPAVAPILQHQIPQIIDHINSYYGYQAVHRIKLTQGPVRRELKSTRLSSDPFAPPAISKRQSTPQKDAQDLEDVKDMTLAEIADPGLRHALLCLAHNIHSR